MPPLAQETAHALFEWALRQARPFTAAEAVAAVCPSAPEASARVPAALAVHPSIAAWDGRFYTPRALAARTAFLVGLQPFELRAGVLVPGHRLLPFRPFDAKPEDATLIGPGGVRLKMQTVSARCEDAEACYAWLGRASFSWPVGEPNLRVTVPAFRMAEPGLWGKYPRMFYRVRCSNYDAGEYEIAPVAGTPHYQVINSSLVCAMNDILTEYPAGPHLAARQALHALARCYDEIGSAPVGPLGTLFSGKFDLADVKGRAVYVHDAANLDPAIREDAPLPPAAPAPPEIRADDPAGPLLREIDALLAARDLRSRHWARGWTIENLGWNDREGSLAGIVSQHTWYRRQVVLDLQPPAVPLKPKCDCGSFPGICEHAAIFLRELARQLRGAENEFTRCARTMLELPPWRWRLQRLDRVLAQDKQAHSAPAAEERLAWRLSDTGDGLGLEPILQKLSPKGAWSAGKAMQVRDLLKRKRALFGEADLAVARLLAAGEDRYGMHEGELLQGDVVEAMQRLAGHPRVTWEDARHPIRVECAVLKFEVRSSGDGALSLGASAGELPLESRERLMLGAGGLVAWDADLRRFVVAECSPRAAALAAEVASGDQSFPKEAAAELEARLAALESVAPVDLPAELAGEEVAADTRTVLRLCPRETGGLDAAMLVRPLPGIPSVFRPGEGPARAGGAVDGKRRSARRDLAAEAARAAAHAETLGLRAFPEMGPFAWSLGGDEDALGLVERLQTGAPEDLTVEWPDKRLKLATASVPELRVRIEEKNDWFGVDGDIEVDGRRVTLAALLEALRNNRRFVQVSPGQWLAITREFRERLRELADLSLPGKSGLELSPVAAPFLAELLEEAGLVQACASWRKLHERFQAASRLAPEPPAALAATLRDYQVDGYRWMARLAAWGAGACLADDMGLGKTVQALALLIDRAAEGPALVVAPTSVASNWLAEAARFAPTLRPLLYRETDRHIAPDTFKPGDLVIASYGLALRDAAKLEQVRWGTLILDEAQFVKNSRTQTAAAIRRIPARWRLALTGTPLENHLGDLWSLFRAVSPGLFGSWDSFRDRFAAPIERDRDPARRHALARLVRPFILRRAKSDVLQELPPRTEITLQAELSPDERALYDQARLLAAARFADPSRSRGPEERIQVLAALTRLRQLACHPRLVLHDAPASSAKLRLFLQTVAELREGRHRALVFSQFTSFLALVREALDAQKISYRYLDGSTPPRTRDAEIAAFQSGQGDLFLISLKAGGTGLNLTAADYVLHLDPWWNPAVEDQATDRAHRIGQTRPVTVYRLVAADTIEDKILAMHGDKRELVASVLEGTDRAARLSTEDLIALIREGVGEEAGVGKGRGPGA